MEHDKSHQTPQQLIEKYETDEISFQVGHFTLFNEYTLNFKTLMVDESNIKDIINLLNEFAILQPIWKESTYCPQCNNLKQK